MNGNTVKSKVMILLIMGALIFPLVCNDRSAPFLSNRSPDEVQAFPAGIAIAEGSRGWTRTEVISTTSTTFSSTPKIATDQAGNVYLVWYDYILRADADLYYTVWNATTWLWTPVEDITYEHTGDSFWESIAVDGKGDLHVVWVDSTNYNGSGTDYDIFYKRRNATTGMWTPTVVISDWSNKASVGPAIAIDPHGNVHIVWQDLANYSGSGADSDIFYRSWNATTDLWSITQLLSTNSTKGSSDPSITVDPNGNIHVVWMESIASIPVLFYNFWNATSHRWGSGEQISTGSQAIHLPKIAADGAGHLHVVWYENTGIFYKQWNATTGQWTTTELVSTESSGYTVYPSLAIDIEGNVHVAWGDTTNLFGAGSYTHIFYKLWNATTGTWTPVELISTESTNHATRPTIAVDQMGFIHIAWEDQSDYLGSGTDTDVFYKRTADLPAAPELAQILPNPDGDGVIALNWTDVVGATSYYIYRDTSPIVAVGGMAPIGAVTTSNYTDTLLANGTFFYAVRAGTGWINGSLSNCESVLVGISDAEPPIYSQERERWSSPQDYMAQRQYQFNFTIYDNVAVDTVLFEWEGTNYTIITHVGAEYYADLCDLGAGTYQYRWAFNDTANQWNATPFRDYVVEPAAPGLELLLNGTAADLAMYRTQACNATITLPLGGMVALYVNESYIATGLAPLMNITAYPQAGWYNLTAYYAGTQNYTAAVQTRWVHVIADTTLPSLLHVVNLTYLNCTALEYQQTGLHVAVQAGDNFRLDRVVCWENSTGAFLNRTMMPSGGAIYALTLDIVSLNYGAVLAYSFYANDTSGNGNCTPWFHLRIQDFTSPGPCEVMYGITYAPHFVLENNTFTLGGGNDFGGSGIATYCYQVGVGPWITATTITLAGIPNGVQTISFRAVDVAGNNGTTANVTVYVLANTADYDGDGLSNAAEFQIYQTHPLMADTDGDGFTDGAEVAAGTDPLNARDNLQVRNARQAFLLLCLFLIGMGSITSIFYLRLRSHRKIIS